MVASGNEAKTLSLIKYTLIIFIITLLANIYLSKFNNSNKWNRNNRKNWLLFWSISVDKYLVKVNNKDIRTTSTSMTWKYNETPPNFHLFSELVSQRHFSLSMDGINAQNNSFYKLVTNLRHLDWRNLFLLKHSM